MKDLLGLMGKAKEMQAKFQAMQEEIATLEQVLSRFIGPMARMLLRRELSRAPTYRDLVVAMADTLDNKEQREAFLQALRKALPRRNV